MFNKKNFAAVTTIHGGHAKHKTKIPKDRRDENYMEV